MLRGDDDEEQGTNELFHRIREEITCKEEMKKRKKKKKKGEENLIRQNN